MWSECRRRRGRWLSQVTEPVVFATRLGIACGMIAAIGCGNGSPPTGTVQGTVTIRGEGLAAGQVCVISKAGVGAVAAVAADGAYRFADRLPVGEYTAWLEPPARVPGETSPPPAGIDDATWQRWVPRGYRTQSSSPLRMVVQPGTNTVPIDIAD